MPRGLAMACSDIGGDNPRSTVFYIISEWHDIEKAG